MHGYLRFLTPMFACVFWVLCLTGANVGGFVYQDENGNGVKDQSEPGIAGVMVSNQREVIVTDKHGHYELPVEEGEILFITKPAGYRLPLSEQGLPKFYYIHKPAGSPNLYYKGSKPTGPLPASVDFPLQKSEVKNHFKAIVLSDPQPETLQEVDYIRRDFVEELIGTDACMGVTLGDIAFDDLSTWEYYNPLIAQIGVPFYNVIGNHDCNYDAKNDEYSDEAFECTFGPNYYSFDYGQVHFVALDSVYHFLKEDGRADYVGKIGEKQLAWLKNDLTQVPSEKLVVLMMHIPLYTYVSQSKKSRVLDREVLFEIVKNRPHLLALAGHTHTHEHHKLGPAQGWHGEKPLPQIVCVTLAGSWWSGRQDERGVPVATQRDGVPNGYQIIEFDGANYRSSFKAAGKAVSYQLQIYAPHGMISEKQLAGAKVAVNVFDSSVDSQVLYSIDRGTFLPMENEIVKDPLAKEMFDKPHDYNKPWVRAVKTAHMWTAPAPNVEKGMHTVTVKTIDRYGRVFSSSRVFFVY